MTMEYMEGELQRVFEAARESSRRDAMFRRFIDMAAHTAMRHMDHIDSEIEQRDLHHCAITAAMTALHLAIESDAVLKQLTAERDRYKELAEKGLSLTSRPFVFFPEP